MRAVGLGFVSALALTAAANAADLSVPQSGGGLKDSPVYAPNVWTGFYVGTHGGAAVGTTTVADPFGPSIFGDKINTIPVHSVAARSVTMRNLTRLWPVSKPM
jgi:opacity protein-like surface antigen